MKRYIKEINGEKIIKFANSIIIIKDGFQIINPTEEMILDDGWTEYVENKQESDSATGLTKQEKIELAKNEIIKKILEYDSSFEVNCCHIEYQGQTFQYWPNKMERSVLKSVLNDYIFNEIETYRLDLRDFNISIEIGCTLLQDLLSKLEIYASQCYNTTTDHLFNVRKLTALEKINNYDYKTNYPEKLTFNV